VTEDIITLVVAFCFGLFVGRWWALIGAVAFGVWVGFTYESEVSGWFIGLVWAAIIAVPVVAGVGARKGWGRFQQAHMRAG
jgi:hypothetical protein